MKISDAARFVAGISFMAMSAQVWAQAEVAPDEGATSVGDIVVTAQRRSERLREVPMSVAAITGDILEKQNVTNTADLARLAPGINMPLYGAFLQPAIRGVSSTGGSVGDSANVAMFIDGIYQPQQISTLIDLPDVQQIEVLKGPQGTLYGQNATGGAILVTSLAPKFSPSGIVSVSYGSYNDVRVRAHLTGPVFADKIAVSLSGGYQNRDGFRRQVVTGERDRGLDSKVVRGKVLFEPSETAKVTLTGYYSLRTDSAQYAGFALNGNSVGYNFFPAAPRANNPSQFATDPYAFVQQKSYGGSIRGEFELDAGKITTSTALFRNRVQYHVDADYSPVHYAEVYTSNLAGQYFIQDVNYASSWSGPFDLLVGGLYISGHEEFDPNGYRLRAPSLIPNPPLAPTFDRPLYSRVEKEIIAGFAEVTYRPAERFVVTAGGRFTYERHRAFANLQLPVPSAGAVIERPKGPATFSKFTPRITARYELTPRSNVYASWGQGFKSGVMNVNTLTIDPVEPEVVTSYEIGYKGRVFDGFTINAAAFYYDYKDLQVASYQPPVFIQQNAASARIKGAELEASWVVSSNLNLSGSVAVLDAKYTRFPAAQVFIPNAANTGNLALPVDLAGRRMQRAPKFTANAAIDYHVETDAGRFAAYASLYHNSGFGFEVSNRVKSGSYTTIDGEISFAPSAFEGLRLVIWGKNLGNKAYLASFLASQLTDGAAYADPRTFGARVEYKF